MAYCGHRTCASAFPSKRKPITHYIKLTATVKAHYYDPFLQNNATNTHVMKEAYSALRFPFKLRTGDAQPSHSSFKTIANLSKMFLSSLNYSLSGKLHVKYKFEFRCCQFQHSKCTRLSREIPLPSDNSRPPPCLTA